GRWSDGGVVDVDRVGAALRRQGAMLLVDATHAAGVMTVDVRSLDPDFLVFPTYKWLLGPYAPFSTSPNVARTACPWSRPAMAAAPSPRSGRATIAIPSSSPARGVSLWHSPTISPRYKWPLSACRS